MKFLYTFLFFNLLVTGFSQDWRLEKVDSTSKFRFEYVLNFKNLDDSSTYELKKLDSLASGDTFRGLVKDNEGKPIPLARLLFKNEEGLVTQTRTSINGNYSIEIQPGKYEVTCLSMSHDVLKFNVDIRENEYFELNCHMGLAAELINYRINSVDELSDEEKSVIMNCIKANRSNPYELCSVLGAYYITIII